MKWGNVNIKKKSIIDDKPVFEVVYDSEDKDFSKKVKKITWLTVDPNTNIEVEMVFLDQLITQDKIGFKYNHPDPGFDRDKMKFMTGAAEVG